MIARDKEWSSKDKFKGWGDFRVLKNLGYKIGDS